MDELNENYLNTTYDKFFDIDRKVLAKLKQEDGDERDNEREHQFLSKISMLILKYRNFKKKQTEKLNM